MVGLKYVVALSSLTAATACGDAREDEEPTLPTITVGNSLGDDGVGSDDAEDGDDDSGEKLDLGDGTGTGNGGDGMPVGGCTEAANAQSNQGCEFWAVDLPNAWAGIGGSELRRRGRRSDATVARGAGPAAPCRHAAQG